jgi:glycosyltransferase involved in cell wall biosynthesis
MTPMRTGGENGGIKLLAKTLVEQFGHLKPDWHFVLFTSRSSHEELRQLETRNIRCVCIREDQPSVKSGATSPPRRQRRGRGIVDPLLRKTDAILRRLQHRLRSGRRRHQSRIGRERPFQTLSASRPNMRADLLFSPFTAPLFDWSPTRPIVSVVADLQYRFFSEFFTPEDLAYRHRSIVEASRRSQRLICISNHTRQTVLDTGLCDPTRVETVHIGMSRRMPKTSLAQRQGLLSRLGLTPDRYLLYPANFWRHKNHLALLTAFSRYRARHPESNLQLILAGADTGEATAIRAAIDRMGLSAQVRITGYLSDAELSSLMRDCAALIFPSLFEGFGMPPVEAMALGKIVLSSNVTSLPEVVGEAGISFDPHQPAEITAAIERLEKATPTERRRLIQLGYQRVRAFSSSKEMARKYLRIIGEALDETDIPNDELYGVFADGWTSQRIMIAHKPSQRQRKLQLTLCAPQFIPAPRIDLRLLVNGRNDQSQFGVERNAEVCIEQLLPAESGILEFIISPVFVPSTCGLGPDDRHLGLICRGCRVQEEDRSVELLAT